METIVTQIIENWKNMSSEEFDEYMQNQQRTLLREEMEQIMDAFDEGQEYEYQYHINNTPKFDSKTYYDRTYGSKGSETQGYICPQTKKQCRDECCVSAEDCHIQAGIGVIFDCEQEPTSSQTNSMNTFFILPLLTYCKFEDGKQINIGWLKKAWTINIEFKQPKKD